MSSSESPINPVESQDKGLEKISRDDLIAFAKEKPPGDPEVKEMLLRWMEETSIPDGSKVDSWETIDVDIMHTAMKYRLGFLNKEEVIAELEELSEALAGEYTDPAGTHDRLSQLLYAIEDGTFE